MVDPVIGNHTCSDKISKTESSIYKFCELSLELHEGEENINKIVNTRLDSYNHMLENQFKYFGRAVVTKINPKSILPSLSNHHEICSNALAKVFLDILQAFIVMRHNPIKVVGRSDNT